MSTPELYRALSAARAEIPAPAKDSQNTHLRNRYASLSAIIDACALPLGRHGLTFSQPIVMTEFGPVLRTILVHLETGQSISGDCPLLHEGGPKINPMQALGSAITYARRYGLESLLGLKRDDDDGEGAYPSHRQPRQQQQPARQANNHSQPRPQTQGQGQAQPAKFDTETHDLDSEFGKWVSGWAEAAKRKRWAVVGRLYKELLKAGEQDQAQYVQPDLKGGPMWSAVRSLWEDEANGWPQWMHDALDQAMKARSEASAQ